MAIQVFAAPEWLIALPSDHAQYAAYDARIRAVASPYELIGGGQTYAGWTAAFDAAKLDDPARILNVMANLEYPWLGCLQALTDATPSVAWYTTYLSAATTEFTRQGLGTPSVATSMATWKQAAETVWQDVVAYAIANGTVNIVHYGSPGWATANTTGAPLEGFRSSATKSYWGSDPTYYPPYADIVATTYAANGELPSLMRANNGATADGLGFYSSLPTGADWPEAVDSWQLNDSGVFRKSSAGVNQATDYESSMMAEWLAATLAACTYYYRLARDECADADPTLAAAATRNVAMLQTLSPASPEIGDSSYLRRNHWVGLFDDDPATRAQTIFGSLVREADADTPNVRAPEEVWIWDSAPSYWRSIPVSVRGSGSSSAQKGIDQVRHAYEKLFFGRPVLDTAKGDPTGLNQPFTATVPDGHTTHDAWIYQYNLGDTYWAYNNHTEWRSASGVTAAGITAAGLVIDFTDGGATEALAPYLSAAQVAGTAAITIDDFRLAIAWWVTEYLVSALEHGVELLADVEGAGMNPVIFAFTSVENREPTSNTLIHLSDGTVRAISVGEGLLNNAAGETPRLWFVDADGNPMEFLSGGGSLSDGDKGDITVSGSGATWNIDAGAVGTTELATAAVSMAKLSDLAGLSVIGRASGTTGVPAAISTSSSSNACLRESAGALAFGRLTLSGLVQAATDTLVCRVSPFTGDLELGTFTDAGQAMVAAANAAAQTALLSAVVGDSGSGGTKGLVPAPASGDAAKVLLGNGTWSKIATANITANSIEFTSIAQATTDTIVGRVSPFTGNLELVTFTDQAQGLCDDTSYSAMRTTLGLGEIATASLADPGADRGVFWDDSASLFKFFSVAGDLSFSGTALRNTRYREFMISIGDETTAITTGTAKYTFRMPYAMNLTELTATVTTAPVGSVITIDINESGVTILSTKITIDDGEKTSRTAATPPVIGDAALADSAEITIDYDTVGSGTAGAGVKIWFIGTA